MNNNEFQRAYAFVLKEEGGLNTDVDDRGGRTYQGVTQERYDKYRGFPHRDVAAMTTIEREAIYRSYWDDGYCDEMRWPLNLAHFDACFNHGPEQAIRLLQRVLDLTPDSIYGPKTRAAVKLANETTDARFTTTYAVMLERVFFYDSLDEKDSSQTKFLTKFWLKRLKHLYKMTKISPSVPESER